MKKTHRPLVIGNWKMNPESSTTAARLATEVKKGTTRVDGVDIVVAPPHPFLLEVRKVLNGSRRVLLGAQDAHWEVGGPFTGSVSLPMLADTGVVYVIVGHSERRAAGETDSDVHKKVHAVLKARMIPVVCVGEKKRDSNAHYLNDVEKQVRAACAGISKARMGTVVIAYEPVWAIGTGNTATPDDAHEMKIFIQRILTDLYGRNVASKVRILYGGSVTEHTAEALMAQGTVDGFLVGGASLRASEFLTISTVAARTATL
ncbi:triose-phosphate isomerase [Candidatus Kaiserbacteria bacterium]|nr:triose-phosphate isomerase [Candidatus Kaiserbacteria bacterium]